jgi:uncharacterized protein (TIGR02596 family)
LRDLRDARAFFVRGFSLLELLVVVVLVAGLGAAAVAGYLSLNRASAVTTGAAVLSEALTEGRQEAVTQNITVEVRLYAAAGGGADAYRTLQLHAVNANGTPALQAAVELPTGVVMDATAAHSTLIGANGETPTPDATDSLLNAQTRVFHFLPDGSTDLNPATTWSLTVRAATQSDPAHFPNDWACLVVDPPTGRVQIYRP